MKKEKGQYGYRDSNRRMRLGITLVLLAAIIAQVVWRELAQEQAMKNILTVMAILTVLPMANMASPLLASWKYRTSSAEFYRRVQPYEAVGTVLYDLVLTTEKEVLPMDAVMVHPNGIYAYCIREKTDTARAETALKKLLAAGRLELPVKIFLDEHSFFGRLDTLKPTEDDDGQAAAAVRLLKSLSM